MPRPRLPTRPADRTLRVLLTLTLATSLALAAWAATAVLTDSAGPVRMTGNRAFDEAGAEQMLEDAIDATATVALVAGVVVAALAGATLVVSRRA